LLLKLSARVGDEALLQAVELVVERVGLVGEVGTQLLEDLAELGVQAGSARVLGTEEVLHVFLDLLNGQIGRRNVRRTTVGLQLGLDDVEERLQLALLTDPLALLGLAVLAELRDKVARGLVVVTQRSASQLGGLVVDLLLEGTSAGLVVVLEIEDDLGEVSQLANTATSSLDLIQGGEDLVELSDVGHDGSLIRARHIDDILSVQKTGNIQVLLGDIESQVEVSELVLRGQLVVVDEIRAVTVDESAEGQTVLEGTTEVLNVDVVIRLGLALAPQEKTFLGGETFLGETGDGKTKNQGPHKTEGQLDITRLDFFSTNTGEFDTMFGDEFEGSVEILNLVNLHLGVVVDFANTVTRDGLQKVQEHDTILEVSEDGFNLLSSLDKVGVDPVGERLGLDAFPLFDQISVAHLA